MLNENKIQIPLNISTIFVKIINEKFLCLKNTTHNQTIYVKIPSSFFLIKKNGILRVTRVFSSHLDNCPIKHFNRFLIKVVNNLRVLSKKNCNY